MFIRRLSEKSCYSFRVLVHNITSQSQVRNRDSQENTYFGSEHNFQKLLNAKYTFFFGHRMNIQFRLVYKQLYKLL